MCTMLIFCLIGEFGLLVLSFKHSQHVYVAETVNYFEVMYLTRFINRCSVLALSSARGQDLPRSFSGWQEAPQQNGFLGMWVFGCWIMDCKHTLWRKGHFGLMTLESMTMYKLRRLFVTIVLMIDQCGKAILLQILVCFFSFFFGLSCRDLSLHSIVWEGNPRMWINWVLDHIFTLLNMPMKLDDGVKRKFGSV